MRDAIETDFEYNFGDANLGREGGEFETRNAIFIGEDGAKGCGTSIRGEIDGTDGSANDRDAGLVTDGNDKGLGLTKGDLGALGKSAD